MVYPLSEAEAGNSRKFPLRCKRAGRRGISKPNIVIANSCDSVAGTVGETEELKQKEISRVKITPQLGLTSPLPKMRASYFHPQEKLI